ncbi:type II toxin-antitoxin system VapC family toxin [bacterium]|nr:type II toxin-antitoxin system VapC family toxin [bacterium]
MIVVDTNIISYLFIKGEKTEAVKQVLLKDSNWVSPILWRSEFRSVLSLYLRKEYIDLSQANYLMGEAESLMLSSEYHVISSEVLEMLTKTNLSAYDCEFVALAKELGVHLITSDKKILKEVPAIALSINDFLA